MKRISCVAYLLVILALAGAILLVVSHGNTISAGGSPSSTKQPPIYLNAINLMLDYTSAQNVKRATFQTHDSTSAVRSYYIGELQNDGWKVDTVSKPATPDSLYLSWSGPNLGGFSMDIVITPIANGLLKVEINLVVHNLQL